MVRPWVPETSHDREFLVVPQRLHALHARVEAEAVAEVEDLRRFVRQLGPGVLVGRVAGGDDGVEAVVSTVEGDDDQHTGVRRQGRGLGGGEQVGPVDLGGADGECAGRGHPGPGEEPTAGSAVHNRLLTR
ncbi:hypothetical protein GCM10029964_072600 [Kibdelosporangium lantanae]